MASSSSSHQQSYAQRGSNRNQQRYVPKSTGGGSINKISTDDAKPIPPLTTSLRAAAAPSSKEKEKREEGSGDSCSFVNYLPQDEAVASGLGAEAGGLDAMESQRVVDILNEELSRLLKMRPRDFWREVARNDSLHEFLNSYLQFRYRWYDFPHRGAKGMVAGVIVGEIGLCRRVFMILSRISSYRDPGASTSDCLSMKEHTALLQEKKLLDLQKLMDICAIYGHENGELTKSLVTNAMKAQPMLVDNLSAVVSHFLSIVQTMHQRCSSSLEALMSSRGQEDHGHGKLYQDFLEVMDFINDAVVTLDALADSFKPAALYFSISFDTSLTCSYGSEELLNTLAKLHDSLLPSLQQGLILVSNSRSDASAQNISGGGELRNIDLSLQMLSTRIVSLGWKLLEFCYLCDEPIEDGLLHMTTKMFPAKVEDPGIRGDIIVQTFKEISVEALYHIQENGGSGTFLQNLEKNYKILSRIGILRDSGWIFMDEDQFQYIAQIASPPSNDTFKTVPKASISSQNDKACIDEDAIIMESKISQIKDLFPDYGKGFLSACLDVYNHNPEEVIQRILEGTLHEDLLSLDTSLEHIPPPKPPSHRKKDKGKGVLVVEPKVVGPPSSSSSTYGRFIRKTDEVPPTSKILDLRSSEDSIRTSILAAELEYEDEYDDSFDDLGLSVVESGFEETENSLGLENETSSKKWGSSKKPQFYVKDGKNYSYKVSGSVAVSNVNEAALLHQAQKDMIHGLGCGGNIPHRGGNIPFGHEKKTEDEEQDEQSNGDGENGGRGNSSSRGRGGGGRGGGRNHYRKDRAMKKHFSGMSGY